MKDADLAELAAAAPDRPLDRLEADIWAGVEARQRDRRRVRLIASCQAGVLALALAGGFAAGHWTSTPPRTPWLSAPGAALAPSTLLIGG